MERSGLSGLTIVLVTLLVFAGSLIHSSKAQGKYMSASMVRDLPFVLNNLFEAGLWCQRAPSFKF